MYLSPPRFLVISPKAAHVISFLDILQGIVYAYSSQSLYSIIVTSIESN